MNIEKDMQLDDTLVKIAQTSRINSCLESMQEIKGECYVSRDKKRNKKILMAKKTILGVAAFVVLSAGIKIVGDMDSADMIRKETTKTETSFNPIGGKYETNNVYDNDFVVSMNNLSDYALNNLYKETSNEMKADGNIEDATIVSEVVEEMENKYLEEQGRSK